MSENLATSRREAKERGVSHYVTGKPCKNGHVCARRATGNCVECSAASAAKWNRAYYLENKEKILAKNHEYAVQNRGKIKEWNRGYTRERYRRLRRADPQYKIVSSIRSRLYNALKGAPRPGSSIRLLGCSVSEVRQHLESLWLPKMSWGNHGKGPGTWQIDHIRPLSWFDLTDPQQFVEACHYSNLQPLWNEAHVAKTTSQRVGRR